MSDPVDDGDARDGGADSADRENGTDGASAEEVGETSDGDPFDALEDATASRTDGDPFDDLEVGEVSADADGDRLSADPFTEMDAGVDVDRPDDSPSSAAGTPLDDDRDADLGADEQVVPKRSFCERCEHFSAPPRAACENPGTEIRELVDVDHFLVANCPVVAERLGRTFDGD